MARLNEPHVSADSLETLRRKFLRQNRDIARTNSTQSLKIRSLENECARLLSENLQLRSDVLRLKTELEGSQAHRIAQHALQIKEKMEAQLVEWGSMLASLGHEPVPKTRSPRALKKARIQRSSIGTARGSDWRRRETLSREDIEAAALQEGRLAPLWEDTAYPRETLNQDEILALCSEAEEEGAESPDLGPPPVSRFVDGGDPVKLSYSTHTRDMKPSIEESDDYDTEDPFQNSSPYDELSSPLRDVPEEAFIEESPVKRTQETVTTTTTPIPETQSPSPTTKAGMKRKVREGEEKDEVPVPRSPVQIAKDRVEKPAGRTIKELPASKRGGGEKAQRKPLGTKNSNEALVSTKKPAKTLDDCIKEEKAKARAAKDEKRSKQRTEPTPVQVQPPSSPQQPVSIDVETENLIAAPQSPERPVSREKTADTPPPVDISSRGETTRGSRRARAAISYAEPNLRDKMRRPNTKQLFDAVAGEGKQIRRTSHSQRDESPNGRSSSQLKVHSDNADTVTSPEVQKTPRGSDLVVLPASVTMERKRKDPTATTSQESGIDATVNKAAKKGANNRLEEIAAREVEAAKAFDETDLYEFTNSPEKDEDPSKDYSPEESKKPTSSRPSRSRRLSSLTQEDLHFNQAEKSSGRPGASKKRASMASAKASKGSVDDTKSESSPAEGHSTSVPDKQAKGHERTASNRRRSTMV